MALLETGAGRTSTLFGSLAELASKAMSGATGRTSSDALLRHLEHLALLSPHLLADLGFAIDPSESTPATCCWKKDDIVVLISTTRARATAQRR